MFQLLFEKTPYNPVVKQLIFTKNIPLLQKTQLTMFNIYLNSFYASVSGFDLW